MIDYVKIDTTITIGGIAIHQPVTTFTDIILSLLCFCFFLKLKQINNPDKSTKYWTLFYLFLCLSPLTGSFSHAFFLVHSGTGYDSLWLPMQLFNIWAAFSAQQATYHSALKNSTGRNVWKWFSIILLLISSVSVFIFHNFLVVVIDSAIALIPVMIIHFKDIRQDKNSEFIAWGIVILFITAIINGTKISINEYCTYLDIAHVFIITSLSVMLVGIRRKAISRKLFSVLSLFL